MTNFDDVYAFHQHFQLLAHTIPGHLSPRKTAERIAFMHEELSEFVDAASRNDLVQMADALIDLVYVTMGTAVMMGLPWQALWDVVHTANMRKVRRASLTGDHRDVVKPPGWAAPEPALLQALVQAAYSAPAWVANGVLHTSRDDPHYVT